MVKKPFFSIVIPTYNRATDLQFALFCIFRQSFSDFEVIISDNCSTDETKNVIDKISDKRIHYSRTKETVGNALNIRRGVEQAKGEYVFLHSDDDFLAYENSLEDIYNEIIIHKSGYIRLNYLSLSTDRKRIFSYKVNKPFTGNKHVSPFLTNKEILSFIVDADPYFITGIIFKNTLPTDVKIVDSDPAPWIEILFYVIKNFGGYFMVKPHIIASWSRRKIKKNAEHHFFTLINGKLRCENYFNAVKKKIGIEEYKTFLHNELMLLYVIGFPVIKFKVGNKRMLHICERMNILDTTIKINITYWLYLAIALIFPRIFLKLIGEIYLYFYSVFYKVHNHKEMVGILKKLEKEYLVSKKGVKALKKPIFNFD